MVALITVLSPPRLSTLRFNFAKTILYIQLRHVRLFALYINENKERSIRPITESFFVVTCGSQKCLVEDILCGNRKLDSSLGRVRGRRLPQRAAYANRATLDTDACFSCAFRVMAARKPPLLRQRFVRFTTILRDTSFDSRNCSLNSEVLLCIKRFVT